MRLVPRQLKRSGMTGNVPYYGGRLSPAQAYAASHPASAMPPPSPVATHMAPVADPQAAQHAAAVQQLVAAGVLTPEEAVSIRARIGA